MSKPKKVVKKSKPVTKPKKKVPAKKRRETVKIPRALNKQIAESVATAGEPGPAHDCGPEWDGFYEWIKPLSVPALAAGYEAEYAAVSEAQGHAASHLGLPERLTVHEARSALTKAAKMRHDAGVPYEWPEDVHGYYPEPVNIVPLPPPTPHLAEFVANSPAEETDLCKDPGDGELDTLAHIITDLGYAMRAARFIRRRLKEEVTLDASPGYLLREALRDLAKTNDSLNAVVAMVRRAEEKPAGDS